MSAAPIADAHLDLLLELAARDGEERPFERHWLPQLEAGAVCLQVCPLFSELEESPERALAAAVAQVAQFKRALRESAESVAGVRSAADLDFLGERTGLLLSLEGCKTLAAAPGLVEVFWELGVRVVGLTWNGANAFAHGCAESPDLGLTARGRRLVDRLAELGAVIDLAHASRATFYDVLERAPEAAALVSHAGCRAVFDTPRNVDDDQLRALAERGGVIGVMAHPLVVDPDDRTLRRLADHVEHAVAVAGVDHVALGGDFTHQIDRAVAPPDAAASYLPPGVALGSAIEGLEGPQDYGALVAVLEQRGYAGDELELILHGNLIRLLREALPAA